MLWTYLSHMKFQIWSGEWNCIIRWEKEKGSRQATELRLLTEINSVIFKILAEMKSALKHVLSLRLLVY